MPVAMAALDVPGQLRERSPVGMAVFGDSSLRFADRFVERHGGQSLLARAVSDGSAEATAWLETPAGPRLFRISLWRQRGGERVRVLAAFSACDPLSKTPEPILSEPARAALARTVHDLRSPLAAVMGFAERIRGGPGKRKPSAATDDATDIVAAAWRLLRIAEDLEAVGTSGETGRDLRMADVDVARHVRRVARLAAPATQAQRVTIDGHGLPERGRAPLVIADESALWSVVDNLLQNAIRHAGRGAAVSVALDTVDHGMVLEIADNGPGLDADALSGFLEGGKACHGLAYSRELAQANGAELEIETERGQGLTARLVFPAARCLNPV